MKTLTLLILATSVALTGCGSDSGPSSTSGPTRVIMTTFYPTTWMCERLVGDVIPVRCPLPVDADPIFWQPSTETISDYQRARLIVINGAELEKWIGTASLPRSRVINTAHTFSDRFLKYAVGRTHSHGTQGAHTHEGTDGHTWVDPLNAREQASNIAARLAEEFPEHAGLFRENMKALAADLDALHAELAELTPRLANVQLLASHAAYNYLAKRHGWAVTSFDFDPATPITAEQLAEVKAKLEPGRRLMLWESEPPAKSVADLKAIGVDSVTWSPAEHRPSEGDWLAVMRANIRRTRQLIP